MKTMIPVLALVADERARQDAKWGEQNHPDGSGSPGSQLTANLYRDLCDIRHRKGIGSWADILLEEVYEALAEGDPAKLKVELVQSAAVIVAWIEAIDRRG